MCFSATASFLAAAGLTPIGVGSLQQARRSPAQLLPLAATPLLFAAQQAVEGLVWLGLTNHAPAGVVTPAALTYLGFAFAFWPVWLPWCALHLVVAGPDRWRRRCIRWLLGLGWLLASLLWLPLLLDPGRIAPIVQQGSINYQVLAPGSALVGHGPVTVLYLLVIWVLKDPALA